MSTFCFDIDGVLCTNPPDLNYAQVEPQNDVIVLVNRLHGLGHTILLYTGRGSGTGKDWSKLTEQQLESWGVRYDRLVFGKPGADVYVDDKAVSLHDWRRLLDAVG